MSGRRHRGAARRRGRPRGWRCTGQSRADGRVRAAGNRPSLYSISCTIILCAIRLCTIQQGVLMNVLYTATAHATGDGRNGHARSEDGILDIDMRGPREMGGRGGAANPEMLFAAGYAACFHSALKVVGRQEKLDVDGREGIASGGIGTLGNGGFGLAVDLTVSLPNVDRPAAEKLVAKAHEVCPYSNAT